MARYQIVETHKIYIGDTYPIAVSTTMRLPEAPLEEFDATPITALARLFDHTLESYAPLGGEGITEANAAIDNNIVSFTVPGTHHNHRGRFSLFLTITFEDEQVATYREDYDVVEKK